MPKLNSTDNMIDGIIKQVDLLCSDGKFSELDDLLSNLDFDKIETEISVAWLMSSYPAHKHLLSRALVVEKFYKHLLGVMSESEAKSIVKILRVKSD